MTERPTVVAERPTVVAERPTVVAELAATVAEPISVVTKLITIVTERVTTAMVFVGNRADDDFMLLKSPYFRIAIISPAKIPITFVL